MKIYRITSATTDLVYVGATIKSLTRRLQYHYADAARDRYCSSIAVIQYGDSVIELIEETDDPKREAHWIKELGACNQRQMTIDWSDPAARVEYDRIQHSQKVECDVCGRFVGRGGINRHKRSQICSNIKKALLKDLSILQQ